MNRLKNSNEEMLKKLTKSRLYNLAAIRLKNKAKSAFCGSKEYFAVDFFEAILEGYKILNAANKKKIKI